MEKSKLLDHVIQWVESQKVVRAAILVGSHAEKRATDDLSDYDISLFCTDATSFIQSEGWLENIAKVWVSIPEQFIFQDVTVPTRLAIFEEGIKVDFAFYPMSVLDRLSPLPDEYNMGYKVLVDKDQITTELSSPTFEGFKEKAPSEKEFQAIVKEFWFEVYHVAKYLRRDDLWSVQFRLSDIHHKFLIKMICWNEASKHGWNYTTNSIGKRMQEWVCDDTWKAVHQLFPHFDVSDGWRALNSTISLFKKLTKDTAEKLGVSELVVLENDMERFIKDLENR